MTLTIWVSTCAVFALLMAVDLGLTRNTVGLRAAAVSSRTPEARELVHS